MSAKSSGKPNDKQPSQPVVPPPGPAFMPAGMVMEQRLTVGPLPPPEILKQYDSILPGTAERIIAMAEREGEHRRKLDLLSHSHNSEILRYSARDSLLGQVFAFIIAIGFLGLAAYCVWLGNPWSGTILSAIGIGGIVSTFIIGRAEQKKAQTKRDANS